MTTSDTRHYSFTTADDATVTITVTGEHRDGCKDIAAEIDGPGDAREYAEFDETDDADEVMAWVASKARLESKRSAAYNRAYIQSVMIDRDATPESLLAECVEWTGGYVDHITGDWYPERSYDEMIAEVSARLEGMGLDPWDYDTVSIALRMDANGDMGCDDERFMRYAEVLQEDEAMRPAPVPVILHCRDRGIMAQMGFGGEYEWRVTTEGSMYWAREWAERRRPGARTEERDGELHVYEC